MSNPMGIERMRLDNGLRVVLDPDPRSGRVAVGTTHGVGFRHEAPGEEGLAHLFEHMMFEGSESVPPGAFRPHVHRAGGLVNGTTHQDHTEYHQVAPAASLERMLFTEADRLRAPRFTPAALTEQLAVVTAEIRTATTGRPFGGLPWPLLPQALFDRHANTHDGYGDPDALATVTVDRCAEFFAAHYGPGSAVLTVSGAFDVPTAAELIRRHFADVPSRPRTPPPTLDEPALPADRWVTWTEADVPVAAAALGFRLPDAARDLPAHLAALVLAQGLGHPTAGPGVSAGCGFFGPLDALAPDVLVLTAVLPEGRADGRPLLERVRATLARWAADGLPPALAHTCRAQVGTVLRTQAADLVERTRSLGRLELLLDRAELVDELPGRVDAVEPDDIARAAALLAGATAGGLLLAPGAVRTRPAAPPPGPLAVGTVTADRVARTPLGPRPFPGLGADVPPVFPYPVAGRTPGGLRTAVVLRPGDRAHVTARWPLGRRGWARPGAVDALVGVLAGRSADAGARSGIQEGPTFSTDGQWLTATGAVPTADLPAWIDVLGRVLDPQAAPAGTPAHPPAPRTPDRVAQDLLRATVLLDDGIPAAPGPADLLAGLGTGVLVAVGDVDPTRLADRVAAAFPTQPGARDTGGTGPVAVRDPAVRSVPTPGTGPVQVALTAWEPDDPTHREGARYLAAAVFGTWFDSRLVRRAGPHGHLPFVGRDVSLDRARVFVRAAVPADTVATVLADLAAECRAVRDDPFTDGEIARARAYCLAQLRSVLDSPGGLAGTLAAGMAAGRPADWLPELHAELAAVDAAEVRVAAAALFDPDAFGGVLLGPLTSPAPAAEPAIPGR
ncbi:insulinase family protein [Nakamurella flavida]|uniref:Insulinase family protein n=1 Tax=Nakamurella flavida TaxID=363630 RepID=A0A938YPC5_9ACTN|nr:insulinase family protein [Nakamurella flavida]MBM9476753.1 insulinase family protein [Nakamurella flavida]MDP9778809.1 putative Zn-dependent peptidase [Nakamurella flavida]